MKLETVIYIVVVLIVLAVVVLALSGYIAKPLNSLIDNLYS